MNRVPTELLEALAGPPPQKGKAETNGRAAGGAFGHRLKMREWLAARGRAILCERAGTNDWTYYDINCPFNPDHAGTDCAVMQHTSGKLGARCFHNSCAGRKWADFRDAIGKPDPDHYDPSMPQVIFGHQKAGGSKAAPFDLGVIDSEAFDGGKYELVWDIEGVAVRGQAGLLAGPKKNLKTSVAADFAVSLASATKFLGEFRVPERRRVLFLSGESGEATLQTTARNVCASKGGIRLRDLKGWLFWGFRIPQLADAQHLAALHEAITRHKIQTVLYDPLYLGLFSGGAAADAASNLFAVGPILAGAVQCCKDAGATPTILHHFKKHTASEPYAEPELDDIAYSGCAEHARQWILLKRRKAFDPETDKGVHRLWLSVGGSAGHSLLRAVDVDEGRIGIDFKGKRWSVRVMMPSEAENASTADRQADAESRRDRQDRSDDAGMLCAMDRLDPCRGGLTLTDLRAEARLPHDRAKRAITRLLGDQIIKEVGGTVTAGKGARRSVARFRRASPGS